MAEDVLPQFIDADRYAPVFSTEQLLSQSKLRFVRRHYEEGARIFMAEERHRYTYHIENGLVRLYLVSKEGLNKTLFYHAAGTQFGFQGFKRDGLTSTVAVAATACDLLAIEYDDLLAFCNQNTQYYLAYIEYLFQIMNSQTKEIANLSFRTGMRRLAHLLYSVAAGVAESNGIRTIPYSIDELSEIIGSHRNTVSNALSALRKLGFVAPQTRPVAVCDLTGLKRWLDDNA